MGIHTFVLADLAGYTALTEAHGDETAADVVADFCEAVGGLVAEYGGEQVKSIGDAVLVRVPEAEDAVHFAARLVNDYGARHRGLGIRVGMHTGTAVERGGDWFGSAVNLAARVADRATAGEILLTAATREAVPDDVTAGQLRDRGPHDFKNVSGPVVVYELAPEQAPAALPLDPVCHMAVDPAQADCTRTHAGVTHHFCSALCARAFDEAPERYARVSAA